MILYSKIADFGLIMCKFCELNSWDSVKRSLRVHKDITVALIVVKGSKEVLRNLRVK